MWSILGILLIAAMIMLIELPTLLQNKWKKELWMFSLLLGMGVGLSIAESLEAEIPNPVDWITIAYKPLSDAIFSVLK